MNYIVGWLSETVRRIPWIIVGLSLVLFMVFGFLASQIQLDTGNEGFAPETEELLAQEQIGEYFGDETSEAVVQVLLTSDQSVSDTISAAGLQTVLAVTQAIETNEEVSPKLSSRPQRGAIVSHLNLVLRAAQEQGLDPMTLSDEQVKDLYSQTYNQAEAAQQGFIGGLLSDSRTLEPVPSASSALMLVFLEAIPFDSTEEELQGAIDTDVAIADSLETIDTELGLLPFSNNLLFDSLGDFESEIGRLFLFAALIIVFILMFVYWMQPRGNARVWHAIRRTAADMGITMLTIIMAITFMQGIGYLLVQVNIMSGFTQVTQIVPILMIGLGVDYGIHLTARYREEVGEGEKVTGGINRAIRTVGIALSLATVTTAVGFLTNLFNPIPALKDFGILAAVGVFCSFLLMLTFVPSLRLVMDRRAEAGERLPTDGLSQTGERLLPAMMQRLAVLSERFAWPTLTVTLIFASFGIYGLSQIETEFSFIDFLPEDAPIIQTFDVLTAEFGGGFAERTAVLIEAQEGGDLATTENHNAFVVAASNLTDTPDVVTFLLPTGEVAQADSPISAIRSLVTPGPSGEIPDPDFANLASNMGMAENLQVAEGTDVGALWTLARDANPNLMDRVASMTDDGRFQAVQFDIQTQASETRAADLQANLNDDFAELGILGNSVIPTSENIINSVIIDALSSSQVSSLLITLVVASVVLMINFWFENRRPFLGIITMLPVAVVVLGTFGLMWASGIPFGPVTATLAALAVGIGVPFTIHIARRFEEDRANFDTIPEAMRSTMRHTGGALAGSGLTTIAGFGILITSSLVPFQQMGQVTVYAIGLALLCAVLVLPSLLAIWEGYHRRNGRQPTPSQTKAVA